MRKEVGVRLDEAADFVGPFPSGASGIFTDAIARLGTKAAFIGSVGKDDFGKVILERLKRDGVDTSHVKELTDFTTGVAFVTYFSDGSRQFIFHLPRAATGQVTEADIDESFVSTFNHVHVVGSTMFITDSTARACEKAVDIVKKNGGTVSFDPNSRPELISGDELRSRLGRILEQTDIIFPTEAELELLSGTADPEAASRALMDQGVEVCAVKMGGEGSWVFTRDDSVRVPAFDVEEVDPTGAGDSYCAGFLAAHFDGKSLEESVRYANAVAALSVTRKGPMEGAPTVAEVEQLLRSQ